MGRHAWTRGATAWLAMTPMTMREEERRCLERVLVHVEEEGTQTERDEASVIRKQLERHALYVNACAKLEAYATSMRERASPLVSLRFPMRLTGGTRENVQSGVHRSFLRFMEDLHDRVLVENADRLDDAVSNAETLSTKMASALTLETCRVLDGEVSHAEAVRVVIAYAERCRLEAVRAESEALLDVSKACNALIGILLNFGRTMLTNKAGTPERMRAFLRAADRKGLREAADVLLKRRAFRDALSKHSAWISRDEAVRSDDARLVRIWELLKVTHCELAQALSWQVRRIKWLTANSSAHQCWCGLALDCGLVGSLLHAPAHMRTFATAERVRVVVKTQEVAFACYLASVCLVELLIDLLHEGHLVLNRFDAGYANRILTFDFCKYETVARRILDEDVRPWTERMRMAHAD
tara:strand:+ start:154 stop:1389 length:1236 start_codon:yes stop_codon:yes gene_type:complete